MPERNPLLEPKPADLLRGATPSGRLVILWVHEVSEEQVYYAKYVQGSDEGQLQRCTLATWREQANHPSIKAITHDELKALWTPTSEPAAASFVSGGKK